MTEEQAFIEWKAEQYKHQSTEEELEFVEHLHNFPRYFKKTFLAGYHECQKEHEWHYIKDGIFPTHSNGVLVFTDEGVGLGVYGLDNKKWYTYDTGFDVIAWKEIVLPKESE